MRLAIALLFALTLELAATDSWLTTTPGKAGTDDVVPALDGYGPAVVGSANNGLRLTDAYPGSSASLVVGLSELAGTFKGGVLGPAPDIVINGLPVDDVGNLTVPFALPENIPVGFELWIQFWINEPAPLDRLSATNTVMMVVGEALHFVEQEYPAPSAAHIQAADLDSDGAIDLLATVGSSLVTMIGNGDGTFGSPSPVATASVEAFGSFAVGDFDADGVPDVALPDTQAYGQLLIGLGDGSFASPTALIGTGWDAISGAAAFGDLNHDGHEDVVTCSLHWVGPFGIFLYAGPGPMAGTSVDVGTLYWPSEIAVHDLDEDGYDDILILSVTGDFKVGFGDAGGGFTMQSFDEGTGWGFAIEIGDATGNGLTDVVVATGVMRVVRHEQLTSGAVDLYDVAAQDIAIGDMDLDGIPDLVAVTNEGTGVLLGRGDGTFCDLQFIGGGNAPGALGFDVAVGDFNADGKPDIASSDATNGAVYVFINAND